MIGRIIVPGYSHTCCRQSTRPLPDGSYLTVSFSSKGRYLWGMNSRFLGGYHQRPLWQQKLLGERRLMSRQCKKKGINLNSNGWIQFSQRYVTLASCYSNWRVPLRPGGNLASVFREQRTKDEYDSKETTKRLADLGQLAISGFAHLWTCNEVLFAQAYTSLWISFGHRWIRQMKARSIRRRWAWERSVYVIGYSQRKCHISVRYLARSHSARD